MDKLYLKQDVSEEAPFKDHRGALGKVARMAEVSRKWMADQAADLLWLLTSFDSFDLLYTGRDLSIEKTATTLITTADRSLCR